MTDHAEPIDSGINAGPDPDVVAGLWLAEDLQAQDLAEIRSQLDAEARSDWLNDARARERTRRHLDAIRRRSQAALPPPPTQPDPAPQHVSVHHTFDPQPNPAEAGARLYLIARLIGFLVPIVVVAGAFIILIASASVLNRPTTPEQRARNIVDEHQWTCDDAPEVEALTIDDDGVLWHWITPVGPCDEIRRP